MRRLMRLGLLILLALLMLVGCGGDEVNDGEGAAATPAVPEGAALVTLTPVGAGMEETTVIPPTLELESTVETTADETAGTVSGQMLWGSEPVAGATVELRAPDWRVTGLNEVLETTTTGPDGRFTFSDVSPGEYSVVGVWPDGEVSAGGTPVETVGAGEDVAGIVVQMERQLALLEPATDQPVDPAPVIRWQPVEGIDTYRVLVIDLGTSEAVIQEEVVGDTYTVEAPLEPSRTYTVVVSGMDPAGGEPLASVTREIVVAGEPSAGAPGDEAQGVTIPPQCYFDGLATYIDRALGLCFSAPLGFTWTDQPGSPALIGQTIGEGPEPLAATLSIEQRPAAGRDVNAVIDEYLVELGDAAAATNRSDGTLGGEAAVVLEPVPGRLGSRQVVVVHGPEDAYILTFSPSFRDVAEEQWTAEMRQAQSDADDLFDVVSETLAFLPPAGTPIEGGLALPESCVAAGPMTFLNSSGEYCLAVPAGFAREDSGAGATVLSTAPLVGTDELVAARMSMMTPVPAGNQTLEEVVAAYIDTFDTPGPLQTDALAGEIPAVVLEGVPGDYSWRDVFIVYEDTVFHFLFQPDPDDFPRLAEDVATMYDTFLTSFTFLR